MRSSPTHRLPLQRGALALCSAIAFSLAGATLPTPAEATATLVADQRATTFSGEFGTVTQTPFAPFAAFNAGTFAGSQRSTVTPGQMDATGDGGTYPGAPTESGTSLFQIDFDVDAPTQITLSGDLLFGEDVMPSFTDGRADVALFDLGTAGALFSASAAGAYSYSTVLAAGSYRLRAFAAGGFDGNFSGAAYSLSAGVNAVPEPSTGLMLATGLMVLSLRRASAAGERVRHTALANAGDMLR